MGDVCLLAWATTDAGTKQGEMFRSHFKNGHLWDFPGGAVVKNLPPNAGDVGSIPGRGTKIPHAVGQQSPHTATTELTRLN